MGPDYADVARPLVDLTRKDVSFEWTELHTQAVRQLKQRLIDFTTLQVPDTTKPFELYTDASGYTIGAILEQDGKPIGFLSQVMNPTQQRYSIYDQELLELVMELDKWSHLLRVSKDKRARLPALVVRLPTTESSPEFVRDDLDGVACRLRLHLRRRNPTQSRNILHSQRRHQLTLLMCANGRKLTRSVLLFAFPTEPQQTNREKLCKSSFVTASSPSATCSLTCTSAFMDCGVPQFPEFLTQVLHSHHDHITAGHRGQKKTFAALSKHYYWPGIRAYTTACVESCAHCRASKSFNQRPAGLLQQLLIPSSRWAHVSLDFITDLPLTTTGHDLILVMADSLSKMAHFVPAKKSFTTADTMELLADRLIRYHGFPEVLISDRDSRFQSAL
ncbi:Gag-pol, related [Eimeria necatrix]|uniref:Gag-pol, related n=1 Tax=Eimeria necatrix TaxID=51315 RepID=U6MU97_9EIME|nr:Gag-pol, related [Eimeria necatrix]CDJ67551.1 Gag-pol, related [Eimeria necatrix]